MVPRRLDGVGVHHKRDSSRKFLGKENNGSGHISRDRITSSEMHCQQCVVLLTVLQSAIRLFKILKASMTISPATMAFVVAIAGIMFPAMATKEKLKNVDEFMA